MISVAGQAVAGQPVAGQAVAGELGRAGWWHASPRVAGDFVVVREITCRQALSRSRIPGMDYCLNPYVGCGHGCLYCYASFMSRFTGHAEPWGSYVDARVNAPDILPRDLRRATGRLMIASVTDAYQPAEQTYGITRSCLEVIATSRIPLEVSILTKSDLVVRDLDLLSQLPRVSVGFTITTVDAHLASLLEPGAPSPLRRLAAIERLSSTGLDTWVFIAPVIPGLTDVPEALAAVASAAREAGATSVEADPLNFYPSAVSRLTRLITSHFPGAAQSFRRASAHPAAYRAAVERSAREILRHFCTR